MKEKQANQLLTKQIEFDQKHHQNEYTKLQLKMEDMLKNTSKTAEQQLK